MAIRWLITTVVLAAVIVAGLAVGPRTAGASTGCGKISAGGGVEVKKKGSVTCGNARKVSRKYVRRYTSTSNPCGFPCRRTILGFRCELKQVDPGGGRQKRFVCNQQSKTVTGFIKL
jgi:hypothetical protein